MQAGTCCPIFPAGAIVDVCADFRHKVRELDTHPSHVVLVRYTHHGTKMSSIEQLEAASAEQGATVAALKKQKADKPAVDAAVAELLQKKAALKAALDAALVAAKASGDAAAVAVLEEKIVAVTPRPPTHKQPKKDTAPKGGGGEKPAAAAPPAKKAAPAKPAATPAAKQPAATAAAPAAPAASPSLAALVNVAALDAHMESRSFVAGGPSATQADGRARASAPALDLDLAPVFLSLSFSLSLARSLPPRPPPLPLALAHSQTLTLAPALAHRRTSRCCARWADRTARRTRTRRAGTGTCSASPPTSSPTYPAP